jgi:RNA polymerase sigma-70 factor (ECF subfamily)
VDAGPSRSEEDLIAALAQGDEAAFLDLARAYHASMLRVAEIYVSKRAVAEEVVQETWLTVLNGMERFEGRSSLKTWIFRILTNIAKTRAEREGRTIPISALEPARVPEAAVETDRFLPDDHPHWPGHWASAPRSWVALPEEWLIAKETQRVVAQAIASLPASQRAVISLRDIEGWDSEDVCNVVGVSETNQRVLLHRARSKVRRELEGYLASDEE